MHGMELSLTYTVNKIMQNNMVLNPGVMAGFQSANPKTAGLCVFMTPLMGVILSWLFRDTLCQADRGKW